MDAIFGTPAGAKYIDLLIEGDDLSLDQAGLPVLVFDRDSIAQDIKHAIRESGHLIEMVAERSDEKRRLLLQKIRMVVEEDRRIVPGTVEITLLTPNFTGSAGDWALVADTREFGPVDIDLSQLVSV
ncbi:MAG: DUF2590 family protein [Motiliproteus sp.]